MPSSVALRPSLPNRPIAVVAIVKPKAWRRHSELASSAVMPACGIPTRGASVGRIILAATHHCSRGQQGFGDGGRKGGSSVDAQNSPGPVTSRVAERTPVRGSTRVRCLLTRFPGLVSLRRPPRHIVLVIGPQPSSPFFLHQSHSEIGRVRSQSPATPQLGP